MQRYAYPADLADDVIEKWYTRGVGVFQRPPLPSREQLIHLLETAYLASQETEEGRPLQFTICCTPATSRVKRFQQEDLVEAWPFASPRPLDILELRRLSVSVEVDSAAVWVQFPDLSTGPLAIHGLLNLGKSWAEARNAFALHFDALPDALLVRVDGPGCLTVYQGQVVVSRLESGRLREQAVGFDSFHGLQSLIDEGHQTFRRRIEPPRLAPTNVAQDFEWTAYTNVLLAVVNAIKLSGHGGAVVLAGRASGLADPRGGVVQLKYRLAEPVMHLAEHYAALMQQRHRLADLQWKHAHEEGASPGPGLEPVVPSLSTLRLAYADVRDANQKLAEACGFIGHLAGTDGALVLRTDLALLGFGAEIMLDRIVPAPVHEVTGASLRNGKLLDSEQFGMRHRSAMRLCSVVTDAAVFVVSQDGGVSLVFNHQGRVCFRRNISTTNAHMAYA